MGDDSPCVLYGDSHVIAYYDRKGLAVNHVGAVTMHRVGRDGLAPLVGDSRLLAPFSRFGFIFGEIDIRVHVAKQCDEHARDDFEVLGTLVANYMRALVAFASTVAHRRIAVFSTVPPAGMDYPGYDPAYPRTGSDERRAAWSLVLNQMLRRMAHRSGFAYVDQYSMFVDEDGLLDAAAAREDGVHIRPPLIDRVDLRALSIAPEPEPAPAA